MDKNNSSSNNLEADIPNKETIKAIEESRKIAKDDKVKGYDNIKDLKKALDV